MHFTDTHKHFILPYVFNPIFLAIMLLHIQNLHNFLCDQGHSDVYLSKILWPTVLV